MKRKIFTYSEQFEKFQECFMKDINYNKTESKTKDFAISLEKTFFEKLQEAFRFNPTKKGVEKNVAHTFNISATLENVL